MKQKISTRLTINGEQVTNVLIAGNIESKTKDISQSFEEFLLKSNRSNARASFKKLSERYDQNELSF